MTAAGTGRRGSDAAPVVIAHRGAAGYRPEHTVGAYRLALGLGADAVEPDVVPSRDGVLVVRHENELSTTTDVAVHPELAHRRTTKEVDGRRVDGWFTEDLTWAELSTLRARERIPHVRPANAAFDGRWSLLRLADVLRTVGDEAPGTRVVVELKHPTFFRAAGLPLEELLADELDMAGVAASPEWLTVESFERSVLSAVAAQGLASRRVYLVEAAGAAFDLVARDGARAVPYAEELAAPGLEELAALVVPAARAGERLLHGVSVAKPLLLDDHVAGSALVDRAHRVGLDVWCFTLRPENTFLTPRHRTARDTAYGRWAEEFNEVLGTGVDGVFADHPDLVRAAGHAGDGYGTMTHASGERPDA